MTRLSGVTIPLFSLRSKNDWGIGQITDLPAAARFFLRAGQRLLQVLPANELAQGESSPYGALSAFSIDPIYIGVESVPEVDAELLAGIDLDALRRSPTVDYVAVRALKRRVLGAAFDRFRTRELAKKTERAGALFAFVEHESAWLRDHALYAALRASHNGYGWSTWPAPERDRAPEILALANEPRDDGGLGTKVLEEMYLQWIAHEQWSRARAELKEAGVLLMGDMPFIVGTESADLWAHRDQFRTDVSLGAPPDAFSADGQAWGLPAYDWSVMDRDGLSWIRARARHSAQLFDKFRIDHVVGFFRQWLSAPGQRGTFDPVREPDQLARGERVLRAMLEATGPGVVIAEDLGVIPPWVRETLTRLGMPGYKVLPWERNWDTMVPHDPRSFLELSVATWSTHDTAPVTQWWYEFTDAEREQTAKLGGFSLDLPDADRELALLSLLMSARSETTLVLAQEILGDKTRINMPGTVGPQNWTWRLPRPLEELGEDPAVAARLDAVRSIAVASKRF